MSAFGGNADMTVCGCLLSRSLLGAKRTVAFAPHMSANDPKRTSLVAKTGPTGRLVANRLGERRHEGHTQACYRGRCKTRSFAVNRTRLPVDRGRRARPPRSFPA